MTYVRDKCNKFDFAYHGYQYPLPPSWKRAIRLEDQIQWLLQALLCLNEHMLGEEDLEGIGDELYKQTSRVIAEMQDELARIATGQRKVRSPVDGHVGWYASVLRQMSDYIKPYAMSYAEVKELGLTYADIAEWNHPYGDMAVFANLYFGDGSVNWHYTPLDQLDGTTAGDVVEGTDGDKYELQPASATRLGGVRVGNGLSIDANGVLSATTQGGVSATKGTTYGQLAANGFLY